MSGDPFVDSPKRGTRFASRRAGIYGVEDLHRPQRTEYRLPAPDSMYQQDSRDRTPRQGEPTPRHLRTPVYEQCRLRAERAELHSITPTRIPTPTYHDRMQSNRRYVSSPERENLRPKTHRLLGTISPSSNQPQLLNPNPNQRHIPKSRTMNVFSGLANSFSRTSLSSTNSQPSLHGSDNSSRISSRSNIPLPSIPHSPSPTFSDNPFNITTAQPTGYWAGRFQSLNDRFRQEHMELALADPIRYKQYVTFTESPQRGASRYMDNPSVPAETHSRYMEEEDDKREKRVFDHLEGLCVTKAAKQSLWEFQQAYARKHDKEVLLPTGGRMQDRKGWKSRVAKTMTRSRGSSDGTQASKENASSKTKSPKADQGKRSEK